MFPNDAHVVAVRVTQPLERFVDALGEGALKVCELDDGDEGAVGPASGRGADRHLPDRRVLLLRRLLFLRRRGSPVELGHLLVDAPGARTFCYLGLRLSELRLKNLDELVERLRAGQRDSVDEEVRR